MFYYVLKILDKSASEGNDIGVALDKCIAEDDAHEKELREAFGFIRENYAPITKCRRLDDNHTIYVLCWLHEGKFEDAFAAMLGAISER